MPDESSLMPYGGDNPCGAQVRSNDAKYDVCMMPAGYRTDHVGEGRCYLHGGNALVKSGRYSKILKVELQEAIERHANDPDVLNMEPELATARALFEDFINRYDENSEALLAWHLSYKDVQITPERHKLIQFIIKAAEQHFADLAGQGEEVEEWKKVWLKEAKTLAYKIGESLSENRKPPYIMDIADGYKFLAEITKIVERIEKVRAQNAISRRNFLRVMSEMGRVTNTVLDVAGGSLHAFDADGNPITVYDSEGRQVNFVEVFERAKARIQDQWLTIRVE
jgi:hypothetical protein